MSDGGTSHHLLEKIRTELSSSYTKSKNARMRKAITSAGSVVGVQMVLDQEWARIEAMRASLHAHMAKLLPPPTPTEVREQASCRGCRFYRTEAAAGDTQCIYCDTSALFEEYELHIFADGTQSRGGKTGRATNGDHQSGAAQALDLDDEYFYLNRTSHKDYVAGQNPSDTERVLRIIEDTFKKATGAADPKDTSVATTTFAALKREAYALRKLWQALHERVSKLDELAMCATRVQWWPRNAESGEYVEMQAGEHFAYIKDFEVDDRKARYLAEHVVESRSLHVERGRLTYLKGLEAQAKLGTPIECPICRCDVGRHYCVFSCGHSHCIGCVELLVKKSRGTARVQCSVCRAFCETAMIEQVVLTAAPQTPGTTTGTTTGTANGTTTGINSGTTNSTTTGITDSTTTDTTNGTTTGASSANSTRTQTPGAVSMPLDNTDIASSPVGTKSVGNGSIAAGEGAETGDGALEVRGDYSAKIVAVVRCLMRIQRRGNAGKSIIFSEWQPVLDLVAAACDDNGIPSVRASGATAKDREKITVFKTSPTIHVLLLRTKDGANGLNLVEATHVLLVRTFRLLCTALVFSVHRRVGSGLLLYF